MAVYLVATKVPYLDVPLADESDVAKVEEKVDAPLALKAGYWDAFEVYSWAGESANTKVVRMVVISAGAKVHVSDLNMVAWMVSQRVDSMVLHLAVK